MACPRDSASERNVATGQQTLKGLQPHTLKQVSHSYPFLFSALPYITSPVLTPCHLSYIIIWRQRVTLNNVPGASASSAAALHTVAPQKPSSRFQHCWLIYRHSLPIPKYVFLSTSGQWLYHDFTGRMSIWFMNNSTISHTEINADVTKQELFKKVVFNIWATVFSAALSSGKKICLIMLL